MPDGWRIAFGEEMCAELKVIIEKHGAMEEYAILDIKEKYGELCWYDYGFFSFILNKVSNGNDGRKM